MGNFNLAELLNPVSRQEASKNGSNISGHISRADQIVSLSVYDIIPSEDNFYSMNDMEELKSSIELAGKVLQPLIVVTLPDGKYKAIPDTAVV